MFSQAMIFAAGYGKRLKPLTDTCPKPLLKIGHTTLLDQAIERCQKAGLTTLVINTHHLADSIKSHCAAYSTIQLSYEPTLLETGGGVRQALPSFDNNIPLLTHNSDSWFSDDSGIDILFKAWNPSHMDALLLLLPIDNAIGSTALGDYTCAADGTLIYRQNQNTAPYIYSGLHLINLKAFQHYAAQEDSIFSLKKIWDKMESCGRLKGCVYPAKWCDIGTPETLKALTEFTS